MSIDIVDFSLPEPTMHRKKRGTFSNMRHPFWQEFYDSMIERIFQHGGTIVDIGGGLRIDPKRGNKCNRDTKILVEPYLKTSGTELIITDYTDQYQPDRVEDIHALTFADNSIDGIFCIAVLEHVYDPKKAAEELVRVLKPQGEALLYVPFLYRYHANNTEDYRDYFRYSKDGIGYLFRECTSITICPVRGIFETLLKCTPFQRITPLNSFLRLIDWSGTSLQRVSERQTSGYFVHIVK